MTVNEPAAATIERNAHGSPLLSVLLVSYNSKRFMRDCLESLQRHISVPFEVILVDNGSADGTAEYVREEFGWVRVFESGRNLGFTGGNNAAAREARGKYLLLFNCDTVLLTDVSPGIRILEQDAKVGVVGARMYGKDGELRANTGHFPAPWRLWKFTLQWSEPFAHPYGDPEARRLPARLGGRLVPLDAEKQLGGRRGHGRERIHVHRGRRVLRAYAGARA